MMRVDLMKWTDPVAHREKWVQNQTPRSSPSLSLFTFISLPLPLPLTILVSLARSPSPWLFHSLFLHLSLSLLLEADWSDIHRLTFPHGFLPFINDVPQTTITKQTIPHQCSWPGKCGCGCVCVSECGYVCVTIGESSLNQRTIVLLSPHCGSLLPLWLHV